MKDSSEQPPVLIPGGKISYSRKPFLGKQRGKMVVALCNLLLRAKITSPDQSVSGRVIFGSIGDMNFELKATGGSGTGGIHFDTKIEVDNTVNYTRGTWIHIQSTNSLVTTGIRDVANPTGPLVKSRQGDWVSTQAVPAKTTNGSGQDIWNLPQWPMPDPSNHDNPVNYWKFIGAATDQDCPYG